jgi:hypothetical protein
MKRRSEIKELKPSVSGFAAISTVYYYNVLTWKLQLKQLSAEAKTETCSYFLMSMDVLVLLNIRLPLLKKKGKGT